MGNRLSPKPPPSYILLGLSLFGAASSCGLQLRNLPAVTTGVIESVARPCQFINPRPSAALNALPVNFGVFAWFDASQMSAANGASLATWNDLSGNHCDVVESVVANQPVFHTNQINSLPALSFTAGTDLSVMLDAPAAPPFTLFVVTNRVASASYERVVIFGPQAEGPPCLLFYPNTTHPDWWVYYNNAHGYWSTAGFNLTTSWNQYVISSPVPGAAPPALWQNNLIGGDGDVTLVPSVTVDRIKFEGTAGNNVAEAIFYNRNLTPSEITLTKDYLKTKYALP